MSELPDFVKKLLRGKQILNPDKSEIDEWFPLYDEKTRHIRLDHYRCICVGKINGCRYARMFRILRCTDVPLLRTHEIELDGHIITADFLNPFRQNTLGFQDFVNFDRSAFILLEDRQVPLRLSLIRNRLILPCFDGTLSKSMFDHVPPPKPKTYIKFNLEKRQEIIDHFKYGLLGLYDELFTSDNFTTTESANEYFRYVLEGVFEPCVHQMTNGDIDTVYDAYKRSVDQQNTNEMMAMLEEVPIQILLGGDV